MVRIADPSSRSSVPARAGGAAGDGRAVITELDSPGS